VHCNNLTGSERIIKRINTSSHFSPEQKEEARAKYRAWLEIYEKHAPRRMF
jgi:hypothetical protein